MKEINLYRKITGDDTVINVPADFRSRIEDYLSREIPYGRSRIGETEKECLMEVFYEGRTMQSIANEIGCSREYVRQMCLRAIKWIQKQMSYEIEILTDETPVSHIKMSNRALRALHNEGVLTVGQLEYYLSRGLKIKGIGSTTVAELYSAINERACDDRQRVHQKTV